MIRPDLNQKALAPRPAARNRLAFPLRFALCAIAAAVSSSAAPRVIQSEFIDEGAPYRSCHASTLAETTPGTLVAAWFGGTAEGNPDVCIYSARCVSGRWTPPVLIADGRQPDGTRLPCWNPVLVPVRHGPLLLFYKVGPSPQAWWGMQTASRDNGLTWEAPRRMPDGILGPIKNKPVETPDGTLVCGSSTESPQGEWRVHIERTTDRGMTWVATPPLPSVGSFNSIQPAFIRPAPGRLQILCRTKEMTLTTSESADGGVTWGPLRPTTLYSPNSGFDAVTLTDGRHLLIYNWRSAPGAEPPGSDDGAARGPKTPSWGVRWPLTLSASSDGEHWNPVLTLEDRPLRDGYAYPAIIQTSDGRVHVTYTWGRRRIKHVTIDPGAP